MNEEQAQRFMFYMYAGTGAWVAITVISHWLVWNWRPWF